MSAGKAKQNSSRCREQRRSGYEPAVEQMRADIPANLHVAVDEANRETLAGCSSNDLHAPGPHRWKPCGRNAVANMWYCEGSTFIGISVQHSVTYEDDAEKR
jgi:hypothetical protein